MKNKLQTLLFLLVMGTAFGNFTVSAHDFEDVVLPGPSNLRTTGNNSSSIIDSGDTLIVPVVYWVVMRNATDTLVSKAQLDSATAWLKRDFANTSGFGPNSGISFATAQLDPNGDPTTGIKYVDGSILPASYALYGVNVVTNATGFSVYEFGNYGLVWNHQKYINVYIVDSIYNNYGGVTANVPSFFGEGIFIKASELPRYASHVLSHEMGHFFDLLHTFQGDNGFTCPINSICSTDGDQICDTPPHRSIDAFTTTPCYSGTDVLNSLQNFMSYGTVKNRFTAGQIERMRNYVLNTRAGLTTGDAFVQPTPPIEIAVTSIEHGNVFYACGKGDLQFMLKNEGLDSVSTCVVKAYVDDVVAKTATMPIKLGRGATGFYTLGGVPITFGSHMIKVEISNFNGSLSDYSTANNSMQKMVDVQRKMFYIAAQRSSYDLTVTGTDNYLCGDQVNFGMDYDTARFDTPRWTDANGHVWSEVRQWSFIADSNAYYTGSVQPKKITTGITNQQMDNFVKIYPNPTTDQFTVELKSQPLSKSQIEIIDITSHVVITQDFSTRSFDVDISQLSAGKYIVRITNDQGFLVSKILKN